MGADPEMVRVLLKYGANPDIARGNMETPREAAKDGGNEAIIQLIEQASELKARENPGTHASP